MGRPGFFIDRHRDFHHTPIIPPLAALHALTADPDNITHHTSKQPLNPEDYIAIGLAKCFKLNDGGKLDGACFEPCTYYTHMHRIVAPRLTPPVFTILTSHQHHTYHIHVSPVVYTPHTHNTD